MINIKLKNIVSHRVFTLTCAFIFLIISFNWVVPTNFDADTVLQSIMSTQKVTLFYWGQNRYANFLPFIYSWVKSPTLNLYLIMLSAGFSFFLLLELISDSFANNCEDDKKGLYRLVFFTFLVLVSILFLNKRGIYIFAFAAQPYSLSFLLLGWAYTIFNKNQLDKRLIIISVACIFIATGINPSILIISFLISLITYYVTRDFKYLLNITISIICFIFWMYLSKVSESSNTNYLLLNSSEVFINSIGLSLKNFSQQTERIYISIFLIVISIGISFFIKKQDLNKKIRNVFWILIGFALFWWSLFSMTDYVAQNDFDFRYFFPSILILIIYIASVVSG